MKTKAMEQNFLERFMKGEAQILEWIYQNYGPSIYGHVIKNEGTQIDAEDIFQMTVIAVFDNVRSGKYTDEGRFKHYFVKVGMNLWRSERRRKINKQALSLDDYPLDIEDKENMNWLRIIVKNEEANELYRAMQMLNKKCRDLIKECYFDNRKLVDIAEDLNMKANAVRAQIKRCRDKMKRWIN